MKTFSKDYQYKMELIIALDIELQKKIFVRSTVQEILFTLVVKDDAPLPLLLNPRSALRSNSSASELEKTTSI